MLRTRVYDLPHCDVFFLPYCSIPTSSLISAAWYDSY
ncbi:unnamed protein product [Rhodiola kirilowii]